MHDYILNSWKFVIVVSGAYNLSIYLGFYQLSFTSYRHGRAQHLLIPACCFLIVVPTSVSLWLQGFITKTNKPGKSAKFLKPNLQFSSRLSYIIGKLCKLSKAANQSKNTRTDFQHASSHFQHLWKKACPGGKASC